MLSCFMWLWVLVTSYSPCGASSSAVLGLQPSTSSHRSDPLPSWAWTHHTHAGSTVFACEPVQTASPQTLRARWPAYTMAFLSFFWHLFYQMHSISYRVHIQYWFVKYIKRSSPLILSICNKPIILWGTGLVDFGSSCNCSSPPPSLSV